jgi:hypothetical protein
MPGVLDFERNADIKAFAMPLPGIDLHELLDQAIALGDTGQLASVRRRQRRFRVIVRLSHHRIVTS